MISLKVMKRNNSIENVNGVMGLVDCTLSEDALYLYLSRAWFFKTNGIIS